MKLDIEDIIEKHKGVPCVVTCHGPSLTPYKEKIASLQEQGKILRIDVNEWYDFFDIKPDYWVVSNGEFTVENSINENNLWKQRNYPPDVFNVYDIPLFYNMTADLSDPEFVEQNLKCDYLSYDNKHFKGHRCSEMLKNFTNYVKKNNNIDFTYYGNNSQMWQYPDVSGVNPHCQMVHMEIANAWSRDDRCCAHMDGRLTIQEALRSISGYPQHMGPGQTVGIFCLIFAALMGCNPIYVVGLDLDYTLGYAEGDTDKPNYIPNSGNVGHWRHVYKQFLLDDMRILRDSAKNLGIEIINLNKDSWHNIFNTGDLEI
tara:strand:- start:13969 stop:14913 length:945 start_codon:yes stop_codon:yes gene_type:complete